MALKTIAELSTEFSIEIKQLQNKINYERKKGNLLSVKKNGKNYFEDSDVKKIIKPTEIISEFSTEFMLLKKQHEDDLKQIEKLTKLLDQQQQLTAGILSEKNKLQIELNEEKTKSWFKRIFKK